MSDLFNVPVGLAFDTAGNLYVANQSGNTVSKVTPTGTVSTFTSSASFNAATGLAFDAAGNLFVANFFGSTVNDVSSGAVAVPFTLGGTAVAGKDYSSVSPSPLILPAGQTSASITGTLLVDPGASPMLTFTLGTPTAGAVLGSPAVNTLTITDPTPLPPPPTVTTFFAVGADAGGGPQVNVYNAATNSLVASFDAFAPSFTGGVRVAVDDVNGDGTPDIICAAGPSTAPQVVVIDGTKLNQLQSNGEIASSALLASFYAFAPTFAGGVFVAAGTSSSGQNWIAAGAGAGGGPQVVVWTANAILAGAAAGTAPTPLTSFYAFAPSFSGGVTVALGDVLGTGNLDVICGAGPGGGPQVIVVDGTKFSQIASSGISSALISSFYAFLPTFTGGVFVAAGAINGGRVADIICGAGAGGGPQISIFSGANGTLLASFFDPRFGGVLSISPGVRVGTRMVNGQTEILAAPGPGSPPLVDVFNAQTLGLLDGFFAFGSDFTGGVFLGG